VAGAAEVTADGLPLGQASEFSTADGIVVRLNPDGDPAGLGPALACTRTMVTAARTVEDGRLEMVFADGSVIRVGAGDEYESSGLVGPGGLRIGAGPGSRLTVWSGEAEPG
jgi:hypothetical protein